MKKKPAPKNTNAIIQSVAFTFKFLSIISAIFAFFFFISIAYSIISSSDVLSGSSFEILVKISPIFACALGAYVLQRISLAIEAHEQEGLFSSITLITFSLLITIYSSMFQGTMTVIAVPLYLIFGFLLAILIINKDKFPTGIKLYAVSV